VLVVKTEAEPMGVARGLSELLYAVDPQPAAARVQSLEQVRADRWRHRGLTANFAESFRVIALTIAATESAVVMALAVGQRRHEIGVRMASRAGRERSCAWCSVRAWCWRSL